MLFTGMITASCIGHFGRFGNSLFQYCAARRYAESIGVGLCIPEDWIGRKVFATVNEKPIEWLAGPTVTTIDELDGRDNINIGEGYFQDAKSVGLLSRSKLKEWLIPKDIVPGPFIAVHKRRGDYVGNGYYAVVSDASYQRALDKFGYGDSKGVKTYHCTDKTDPYKDFLEIMNAQIIFRSNSTYPWWAATLSNARVFSPVVDDRTGDQECDFVEGNHPKICGLFSDLYLKD